MQQNLFLSRLRIAMALSVITLTSMLAQAALLRADDESLRVYPDFMVQDDHELRFLSCLMFETCRPTEAQVHDVLDLFKMKILNTLKEVQTNFENFGRNESELRLKIEKIVNELNQSGLQGTGTAKNLQKILSQNFYANNLALIESTTRPERFVKAIDGFHTRAHEIFEKLSNFESGRAVELRLWAENVLSDDTYFTQMERHRISFIPIKPDYLIREYSTLPGELGYAPMVDPRQFSVDPSCELMDMQIKYALTFNFSGSINEAIDLNQPGLAEKIVRVAQYRSFYINCETGIRPSVKIDFPNNPQDVLVTVTYIPKLDVSFFTRGRLIITEKWAKGPGPEDIFSAITAP